MGGLLERSYLSDKHDSLLVYLGERYSASKKERGCSGSC
jgi:hypothetical protein